MRRRISAAVRQQVRLRAGDRCEYCGLSQSGQEATFHLDHVIPLDAGGQTIVGNLALACVSCSLRKAAKTMAIDPASGNEVSLFNPRTMRWRDHFVWHGIEVIGVTDIGRATIDSLELNRPLILAIRAEETLRSRHPPN